MITDNSTRSLVSSPACSSATFGISADDTTHLMMILRSTLYSDKRLAVLREYGANAWDANRSAGRGHVPIEIHLPFPGDLTLRIRDFGPGLSESDVLTVYTKYGKSTKRNTNDAVGSLGIGSKAGFAYSDTFTVTSWHEGTKMIFVAVLDESNRGQMNKLYECPSDEPTGLEVSIAARPEDCFGFEGLAQELFKHFEPRPVINTGLARTPEGTVKLTNGVITPREDEDAGAKWIATMGCVPYRIDLSKIDPARLNPCLNKLDGILRFEIGEIDFAASREGLEYSKRTKTALADKFDALVDEYVTQALAGMDDPAVSDWGKRMRIYDLNTLDIGIPEIFEQYGAHTVRITDGSGSSLLSMVHGKNSVGSVSVSPDLRLVIDDTGKTVSCYSGITRGDYVVRGAFATRRAKNTPALVIELDRVLAEVKLTGVPVVLLSSFTYVPKHRATSGSGTKNLKHVRTLFELHVRSTHRMSPYSKHWTEVSGHTPTDSDVFVIISDFKEAVNGTSFFSAVARDKEFFDSFGVTFPRILGYKSTQKKPVRPEDCTGIPYREWRQKAIEALLTPENLVGISAMFDEEALRKHFGHHLEKSCVSRVTRGLGAAHPISIQATRALVAYTQNYSTKASFEQLARRAAVPRTDTVTRELQTLVATYPMIAGLDQLFTAYERVPSKDAVLDYIKLVDSQPVQP